MSETTTKTDAPPESAPESAPVSRRTPSPDVERVYHITVTEVLRGEREYGSWERIASVDKADTYGNVYLIRSFEDKRQIFSAEFEHRPSMSDLALLLASGTPVALPLSVKTQGPF